MRFNHPSKKEEMKVYLCGPINGCTDEQCKDWRNAAKQVLPDTLDPMRRDYRGREDVSAAEIVEGDKEDIDQCKAILVNYDKPSVGTSMEVLYAWQHGLEVFVVAKPGTVISPWLRYHTTFFFDSFENFFDYFNAFRK
jgi:nucleoside 2-deoxyribosyltransferase